MSIGRDLKGVSTAPPEFEMRKARLNVVEVQVYPQQFRLALGRDWDGYICLKREENSELATYYFRQEKSRRTIESALESLHRLIQQQAILELPPRMPLKIFRGLIVRSGLPTMRLQIEYRHGDWHRNWQCWYTKMNKLPPGIQAFYDGCFKIALATTAGGKITRISHDEANKYFERKRS